MTHLTEEQLYQLADATVEMQPYSEEELEQMEHLKTCESCYDKFCAALAVLEVTSESGYAVLADIYGTAKETAKEQGMNERVLAVLIVIRDNFKTQVSAVIEQMSRMNSQFCFEPQLAFAARGVNEGGSPVYKVEDVEDDKTFVVFDSVKKELLVQVNTRELTNKDIKIVLEFDDGQIQNVPVTQKGNLVKGSIAEIPDMNFEIRMENAAE